jgi:hypothetical protein
VCSTGTQGTAELNELEGSRQTPWIDPPVFDVTAQG